MPTLDWIGKKAVENHHNEIPFRLLKCDNNLSVGDPEEGNLIVQGDNLHALKALLPYYAGKVKCIYIDPPYNTGNEKWIYNDNVNSPEIKRWLNEVVGREGEDLSRHDKWLCMMYPRLQLLRRLLSEDGGIFISVDYNEESNCRLLLDEVFGSSNYRNTFVVSRVKKNIKEREKVKSANFGHNSILFYSKSNRTLIDPPTKIQEKKVRWHAFDAPGIRPTMEYELFGFKPPKNRHWMYSQNRAMEMINKELLRPNPRSGKPQYRLEESNITMLDTNWTDLQEAGFKWNFPNGEKNVELIKRIVRMISDRDSIILDSFAGSGTTAHAVLDLNKKEGGNRKFILVELEENICKEVTAERVKRVISGYEVEKPKGGTEKVEGLGGGFRYCKLTKPLFDEFGNVNKEVKFEDLARHIFFSETGQPLPEKIIKSPLIGIYDNTAYYLLYNGIMGDKTINGGNMLTSSILKSLPKYSGQKIIFGEGTRLSLSRLRKEGIIFKQIPYEVKVT
ncbi:MAG TPA: site-specific DNA-methyltransferase [Ignavibacteria bacterium]|nr:site-specific DNA-methyltransferase [Ignavibacteria bacterium]